MCVCLVSQVVFVCDDDVVVRTFVMTCAYHRPNPIIFFFDGHRIVRDENCVHKKRNEKAKAKITIMVIICHFH